MEVNRRNRKEILEKATNQTWDLCIIGGGITGAGILLDAVSRGMSVLLLEQHDFASGTSGKSTKLIHGGLRYLKNLEFGLVREVGRERAIVYKNAPHITRPEPLLLPLVKGGSLTPFSASIGLWLYDWLAGVSKKERRRMIRKASVMALEPGLDEKQIIGGAWYYEYRTDDARLTLALIRKAVQLGGLALPYARVESIHSNQGFQLLVKDQYGDHSVPIFAKHLINASGPWMDGVVKLQEPQAAEKLLLSQGIHVVVDASRLPIGQAMYFDTPDKRMIFTIPREGKVYIGTTEHITTLQAAEQTKIEHAQYLLQCVNHLFPSYALQLSDIESVWAGVRPLILQKGKKPGEVSRKDELFLHDSGMVSIAGGKLTGYRKMAQKAVDVIAHRMGIKKSCSTDTIRLFDSDWNAEQVDAKASSFVEKATRMGVPEKVAFRWAWSYGAEANQLLEEFLRTKEISGNSWLKAEIYFSVTHEYLLSTMDFLIRRTSVFYFDKSLADQIKMEVHALLSECLGWSEKEREADLRYIQQCFGSLYQ
ncbi:MAG: glycerol-3-phosphate dehydrogenase/oxidase [Cytophagaceae bacterium]|nr:glycerol-3-phosphate dehydrogenase/oxidase [Cytophagaceae bacterium]